MGLPLLTMPTLLRQVLANSIALRPGDPGRGVPVTPQQQISFSPMFIVGGDSAYLWFQSGNPLHKYNAVA